MEATTSETAARVAQLWRQQGEVFLARHHELVEDDVARLRGAVSVPDPAATRERAEPGRLETTLTRLRSWDQGVVERLRAIRLQEEAERARTPGAVVDLTGPEPVVTAPPGDERVACRRCRCEQAPGRVVYPYGDDKPPLCIACARRVAGYLPRRPSRR